MKSRDLQPGLLYPVKLSFRIKGQIKSFPDKKKLKEFIITKPLLLSLIHMTHGHEQWWCDWLKV